MTSDVVVRVGFRPGSRTARGRLFDALLGILSKGSLRVMYWIGTDVQRLVAEVEGGAAPLRTRAMSRTHWHLAGSSRLRSELAAVGVDARLVDFPSFVSMPVGSLPEMPSRFTALTYIPDFRSGFYGGDVILQLARARPDVDFVVMGGDGTWAGDAPANVRFVGWVSDPSSLYARSSCVLRLPEHDSVGATAAEALLYGRPLIYTESLPYSKLVDRELPSVLAALDDLHHAHSKGDLLPNVDASNWAKQEFDPESRFARLANVLREMA
ncbi:glycosyltransferase [Nocardioides ganghwensis]|uniref:Glycosyltransferase family 1 protein n=1 Tax=Nocardioides ganghwensis TaxID=252230 RepID=A0A4V1RMB4_9ACTN|nr:glycosyltransferase [Nocardioides ganghwensis]MBD3947187.1 glycosyltransferase [Nocardioides ganghwensis]RYC00693.1 hypothetical protein EUA07_13430 [Nocardioides ganghwensis]